MDDKEIVEVLDLTLVTTTPGLVLQHTIRAHEGDALVEDGSGAFRIQFGPREVFAGGELRKLPGKRVTIQGAHIVEMTSMTRLEPRVRPSAKALADKTAADLEKLKQQHGVAEIPASKPPARRYRKPSNVTGD